MKKTQKSLSRQDLLLAEKEKQREELRKNSHKYMLDDSTYIVKYDNSTFWGEVMLKMFIGVIIWGIPASQFLDYSNFPVMVSLLAIMIIGIILHSFAGIYRRITFNTVTGEMTYRRLFRPTWRFHRDEITAMEAQMDREFGRVSRLYIHVGERKISLCIGRINQTTMESANPCGIDKTLCDQSNMLELVGFLQVWERAVITEMDHRLIR